MNHNVKRHLHRKNTYSLGKKTSTIVTHFAFTPKSAIYFTKKYYKTPLTYNTRDITTHLFWNV